MVKKRIKNPRVKRTRNAETMTESAFWGSIRSALRRKTIMWKPMANAKKRVRTPYAGPNKRQKWQYKCQHCNKQFKDKEVVVDHIIPAGRLSCPEDLPGFVTRLFCEIDGLQALCKDCHQVKTNNERNQRK